MDKDLYDIRSTWNGEVIINGSTTNSRGVAILLSKDFEYKIEKISSDNSGNLIQLDLLTNNIKIKIINIYAPNNYDPEFF